ncbi:MAG: radical SAM protein [Deltaproteobacteria bacterium]|nr:radical SAM protein [Deltaproteobacteria bacterium]
MQVRDETTEGMPRQEADDLGDRIHVCVGASCNNNCIFCMEDDREDRFDRVGAQTASDVRRMIEANRGVHEILFTSGEPTLTPDLPQYLKWASDAGYRVVGVISNGRRFAYEPYIRQLLDAGMNNVIVSIHGHERRIHDALVRTRGAFAQTLKGLANLDGLRGVYRFRIQTSTVVNRRNLPHMKEFCRLMATLDIDQHVFNVMMPDGRGEEFFDRLMPRYSEVAEAFKLIVPALDPGFLRRVTLVDIPYCATEGLPDSVRGYVERYFHYEPEGSFEQRSKGLSRSVGAADDDELFVKGSLAGERTDFTRVTRTYQESFVKEKRAECGSCRYDDLCRGVWKPYLARFGWDELAPVIDEPRAPSTQ